MTKRTESLVLHVAEGIRDLLKWNGWAWVWAIYGMVMMAVVIWAVVVMVHGRVEAVWMGGIGK